MAPAASASRGRHQVTAHTTISATTATGCATAFHTSGMLLTRTRSMSPVHIVQRSDRRPGSVRMPVRTPCPALIAAAAYRCARALA